MFSLLYDLALLLIALTLLPKLLWQSLAYGKYRKSFLQRIGLKLPLFSPQAGQKLIWIHTVSMGETRAAIPLFWLIAQQFPDAAIVISTTTETGHAEAKRSMPEAAAHFFLPLDFSWTMRRLMKRLQPSSLILVESDFWYQLLSHAKRLKARVLLVNGKISERSFRRFKFLSFVSK